MRSDPGPNPTVAIVGRPNVGKSTLVNRLIGRREAVVDDAPGITRDRVAYDTEWRGRRFTVVDTGGWEPAGEGLAAAVSEVAETAAGAADCVIFVVDTVSGATETDLAVARRLRRSATNVVLVANKVDAAAGEADATALWRLGLGEPLPVSALHGRGVGELLDAVVATLPPTLAPAGGDRPRRVAIVGRPNVGKSSLLNRLAGDTLALVDPVAGTTRDPVDAVVEIDETTWQFIDTAGLRRRSRQLAGGDFYATLRTTAALEAAEVALVVLDASEPVTEQDLRVIDQVVSQGRAMVLVANKWDLLDDERRGWFERDWERRLSRVGWASRVNVSARTGRGVARLAPAMRTALANWERRVPTAVLNDLVGSVVAATPPPPRGGRAPKIRYVTQPGVAPPRFVVFASGTLAPAYRRFLERRLREEFGFWGTPLEIAVRTPRRRSTPGRADRT